MSDIIEHGELPSGNAINIGDSSKNVSIKDYQDIYHQITGRTEQIRKRYPDLLLIDFNEIKQLNIKIMQLCDVHNVIASNSSISVFHRKERKEQFTSFDRFETYNSNTASPTVSVVLKYNFSIIPAGLQKAQEYVITITLNSRITMLQELEDEMPAFIRNNMTPFIAEPVAEVKVDYVDYVIARGFIESFDEWVNGCKKTQISKTITLMKENSHHTRRILRIISVILVSYSALHFFSKFNLDQESLNFTVRTLILFLGLGVIVYDLFTFIGIRIEKLIDRYPQLSYLNLNRGDQNCIENFSANRKSLVTKFVIYFLFNIVLAIIVTKIEKLI